MRLETGTSCWNLSRTKKISGSGDWKQAQGRKIRCWTKIRGWWMKIERRTQNLEADDGEKGAGGSIWARLQG